MLFIVWRIPKEVSSGRHHMHFPLQVVGWLVYIQRGLNTEVQMQVLSRCWGLLQKYHKHTIIYRDFLSVTKQLLPVICSCLYCMLYAQSSCEGVSLLTHAITNMKAFMFESLSWVHLCCAVHIYNRAQHN